MSSSPHTEIAVLGAMLLEPDAVREAVHALSATDFALDSHRTVFTVIQRMYEKKIGVDYVTVSQELKSAGLLEGIGGTSYLQFLTDGIPYRLNVESYCSILRDKGILRAIEAMGEEISLRGQDETQSGAELHAELSLRMREIDAGSSAGLSDTSQVIVEMWDALQPGYAPAIPTGIQEIDRMTQGGIRLGELWIWGALPGSGKTAAARQVGRTAASSGYKVCANSIEMPKWKWMALDAMERGRIAAYHLRENPIDSEVQRRLLRVSEEIEREGMYFFIDDPDINRMMSKFRVASRKHKCKLFVVDHAGRTHSKKHEKEQDKLNYLGIVLAEFAKEENVAVVLLSQLTPKSGDSLNTLPTMQHLRYSRDLEAHAHVVLLNYRPVDEDNARTGEDQIIIGKARDGEIGSRSVRFNTDFLRFDPR